MVEAAIPTPSKIIGAGRNYREHAAELGSQPAVDVPLIFLKPPSALIGNGEAIVLPPESNNVQFEGELVAVIGKRARRVKPEHALEYVAGYTCGNDVTARDLQSRDDQWSRAKGFDSFAAWGPGLAQIDPNNTTVTTRVNGEIKQHAHTSQMIHSTAELISFVSDVMTLEPGDLIYTGTPAGVGQLRADDTVEVEIDGIGVLSNNVVGE